MPEPPDLWQKCQRCSVERLPFKQWPAIFNGDSTITSAVLDRLLHHGHTVVLEGSSYRMKDRAES